VTIEHTTKKFGRNEHVKLDDKVVKDSATLLELRTYLLSQLETARGMSPHMLLDFAKMSVRTKSLEISARLRRKESERLTEINDEINKCTDLLTRYVDEASQVILMRELEELTAAKNAILDSQGESLAQRARN
jgi:hypothetical protein